MSTEKASENNVDLKGIDAGFHADLAAAIEYLKSIGCSEIYLFGSLQSGRNHQKSDIDIAVRGIKPEAFFFVYGELMTRLSHRVDLVDLDLQPGFARSLAKTGSLRRVA